LLLGSTSSEATFTDIKPSIDDCSLNHTHCMQDIANTSSYLPKRILEIRGYKMVLRESPSRLELCLLEPLFGPPAEILKTTTATLDDFKQEIIPWDKLTKTFQDAIDTCRRLGIDFIWIDSLCIIQDSMDDWKEESAKMADIYENAFLTIAAMKSMQSAEGCYTTTNPEFLGRLIPDENIFVRECPPVPSISQLYIFHCCLQDLSLTVSVTNKVPYRAVRAYLTRYLTLPSVGGNGRSRDQTPRPRIVRVVISVPAGCTPLGITPPKVRHRIEPHPLFSVFNCNSFSSFCKL
jgi:hypothetical protein